MNGTNIFSTDLLCKLLRLGDGWEPTEIRFDEFTKILTIVVDATDGWNEHKVCPRCRTRNIDAANSTCCLRMWMRPAVSWQPSQLACCIENGTAHGEVHLPPITSSGKTRSNSGFADSLAKMP